MRSRAGRLVPARRLLWSFVAVALMSATSLVTLLSGTAQAVVPTRIMPLGDSLTNGFNVPGGYRIELEDRLMAGRYDFNFVGSLANGPVDLEARQHEGHNGFRIDEIAASVQTWLNTYRPEFVLLMIGTNDVLQDFQLATAPGRLSSLLDQITATVPSSEVLVSSIPPLSDPILDAKAREYNSAIPGIVSEKRDAGKRVTFVDGNAALTTADLADGVHLTASGYGKVARAWFETLTPLLMPRPPPSPPSCPCSIWPDSAVPGTVQATWDTNPNELGVKFRSDVDGFVSGIRFYKGPNNTGTHVGHLWSRTGTLLATATFTNETSSGWQQVAFDTPVAIAADTTYVASYFAPVGRYSVDATYFINNEVVSNPLRALAWGMSGPNGVYKFGSSGFPSTFAQSSNYWVDVVFTPAVPPPPPPPAAPGNLSATAASSSQIDLSWNDVADETDYRVERSADGTTGWAQVGTTGQDVTSYQDAGLTEATTYFYRVVATNAGGDSPPSATASATTPPELPPPPTAPTGLTATAVSSSQIDLSWNDVATETGYRVERSADGTTGWAQVGTTGQDVTTYQDIGLSPATSYYYRVVATNAGGDSPASATASASTLPEVPPPPPPPSAPSNLAATAISSSQIDLSWNDVATETGYRVERSADGTTGWAQVGTTGQDVTSYQDIGLSPATAYHYRVVATNAGGDSPPSATASASTPPEVPPPPSPPTGLTATAVSSSQIDLSWNDVADETDYRVERSADGTTGWAQVGTTGQDVTSYQDAGLSGATTYFYRVVATNAGGDSQPSAVAAATTHGDTVPPTVPSNLKAVSAKRKVNLSWTGSVDTGGSALAGYEVWRSTSATGTFVKVGSTAPSTTSFSDGSAISGVTYWYYVVSFDGAGNRSGPSTIVQARPK